jgi:hypothetical protein
LCARCYTKDVIIMRQERINEPSTGLAGAAVAGLRVVLAVIAGLVLMLGALLFAVFLGGVVMWKLVGARRGQVAYFGWRGGRTRSGPGAPQGDVIDVDATVLPASQPATPAHAAALAAPAAPSGA